MKELKALTYIKKYRAFIALFSIILGALFYIYFSGKQVYTAQAIIKYTNTEAESGLAPDGTEIDTSEIYSTEVMTKVFQKLELDYDTNNMDAIRAGVSVEPILSEEDEAVQEALNEKGEEAEKKPTTYLVSFQLKKSQYADAENFVSKILTTMLNVYLETYAENHVNQGIPANSIKNVYDTDYDYIEMAEMLQESIETAVENLGYKEEIDFRSSTTGYTFDDLKAEFELLQEIDLSNIYAYVLGNTVTKDQDVLIAKYENRINNYTLENQSSESEADGIQEIIDSYVSMMRDSGNTDFTYQYILQDVYDGRYTKDEEESEDAVYQYADVTTEYDDLMNNYVEQRTDFEQTLIDIGYAEYILGIYSGNSDSNKGVEVEVIENPADVEIEKDTQDINNNAEESEGKKEKDGTISFNAETEVVKEIVSSDEEKDSAYQMIKKLSDQLVVLYEDFLTTNQEYNQFAGARNISILTDAVVWQSLNLKLYGLLAIILFGIIGCAAVIICGRGYEIFEYYVYVDRKLQIANRMGCDKYIQKNSRKAISAGYACLVIHVTDIEMKNKTYGREQSDKMIKDFCDILQSIFPKEESFIAANALGQFVVFIEGGNIESAKAYIKEIVDVCVRYNKENPCNISYRCGISATETDQIYDLRKLMICATRKIFSK